ncbi:hypothetical protein F2Q70_00025236 [Brassica cretica]|uniref:Uncharacterized protein n=1 Tax=Brassica cretica TaxID=69181 RepID=A0A8S9L6I3_BRACR|nr:hypothetical protein F2Q68_00024622 [Brassica cretica]KAF2601581.1 hypothetical protein F2Q70_00025236 [Brassica cretica]
MAGDHEMGSLRSSGDSIEGDRAIARSIARYVATGRLLGRYVATELHLELGRYVATERTLELLLHLKARLELGRCSYT